MHTCFLQHYCLICVHLGARFGFLLDEELKEAASCDEVKDALAAKISRERIGVEVCAISWYLSCFEHWVIFENTTLNFFYDECTE